jgi:hypothetical protein
MDFASAEWQGSTSDERIAQAIREGGAAVGLSPAMPPQADLSKRSLACAPAAGGARLGA